MKLSKEEAMLLESDPQAFLIKAYISAFPKASIRHISEALSIPKTKVHRCLSGTPFGTANGTAKPLQPKGKIAERGTPFGTANGTVPTAQEQEKKEARPTTKMRETFNEFYMQVTGESFYWSAKEMQALKDIYAKIEFSLKSKHRGYGTEDILAAFPGLLQCISDPWILQHLSPAIISSKYNEIISSYRTRRIAPRTATEAKQENLSQLAQMRKAIEDGIK
ncbi:hypothetical protein HMPREF9134_00469 [Porphyromonas catoniae F0037]|uniref:Uncharacterized protein n=1 Tax=Porphyromonas catoniae F0037 TaxID=1127696 RepID=L1NG90_9PORP|nr:hypothetical protein [Porphyromonas catoniae]EKY02393.1 hypothetical protein HMPREF9134_00469 [Porphyromonas catoniae F0037]